MDVREIRRENLRALIAEHKSLVRFAEKVGLDESYFSRIVGPKASRNLGHGVARRIERALELERGWMDKERAQSAQGQGLSSEAVEIARSYDTLSEPLQAHAKRMMKSLALADGRGRKKKRRSITKS